jgi:hypothetical protein
MTVTWRAVKKKFHTKNEGLGLDISNCTDIRAGVSLAIERRRAGIEAGYGYEQYK